MENCVVELLRLDLKMTNRVAFACLRQVARLLYNSITLAGRGSAANASKKLKQKNREKAKGGNSELREQMRQVKDGQKIAKPKKTSQQRYRSLINWQFVRIL